MSRKYNTLLLIHVFKTNLFKIFFFFKKNYDTRHKKKKKKKNLRTCKACDEAGIYIHIFKNLRLKVKTLKLINFMYFQGKTKVSFPPLTVIFIQ